MYTPRSYGLGQLKDWECQKDLVRQKTVNGYCYLDENPKLYLIILRLYKSLQHVIFLIDLCKHLYAASLYNLCTFIFASFIQTARVLENQEEKNSHFLCIMLGRIDLRVKLI